MRLFIKKARHGQLGLSAKKRRAPHRYPLQYLEICAKFGMAKNVAPEETFDAPLSPPALHFD
jgi:hypothetical protein